MKKISSKTIEKILEYADRYFKRAALKFPEDTWIPEQFRQNEMFKDYPDESLIKEFESIGLKDFREEAVYNEGEEELPEICKSLERQFTNIRSQCLTQLKTITNAKNADKVKFGHIILIAPILAKKLLDPGFLYNGRITEEIMVSVSLPDESFPDKKERKHTLKYAVGTSIFKIYQNVNGMATQILGVSGDKLENLLGWKEYSLRLSEKFWVVFSTQLNDLAGISSRGIRSCQSIFSCDEENLNTEQAANVARLPGTILSRYIGVIYISNGKDYQGRGERMQYRCIVRLLLDASTDSYVVVLDKMYPKHDLKIFDIMKSEIQKRIDIPVKYFNEVRLGQVYYKDDGSDYSQTSYHDMATPYKRMTQEQAIKAMESSDPEIRFRALKSIPVDMLGRWVDDPDDGIRLHILGECQNNISVIKALIEDPVDEIRHLASVFLNRASKKELFDIFINTPGNKILTILRSYNYSFENLRNKVGFTSWYDLFAELKDKTGFFGNLTINDVLGICPSFSLKEGDKDLSSDDFYILEAISTVSNLLNPELKRKLKELCGREALQTLLS